MRTLLNRRQFLFGVGATLLVPSTKLISIPSEKFKHNYIQHPNFDYGGHWLSPGIRTSKYVIVDTVHGFPGTQYPIGTTVRPVNNYEDAIKILKKIEGDMILNYQEPSRTYYAQNLTT